jgi:hypothetical protein
MKGIAVNLKESGLTIKRTPGIMTVSGRLISL